jgi:hypothetical protein
MKYHSLPIVWDKRKGRGSKGKSKGIREGTNCRSILYEEPLAASERASDKSLKIL